MLIEEQQGVMMMSLLSVIGNLLLGGVGCLVCLLGSPFGVSSQGDGAMPRTTWRLSTSRAVTSNFKNRFNQVPSVTEYPLIKRIRTDTTIDLSKILPRRVTCSDCVRKCIDQTDPNLWAPDLILWENNYDAECTEWEDTVFSTVLHGINKGYPPWYKGGPESGDPSTMDLGCKNCEVAFIMFNRNSELFFKTMRSGEFYCL